MASLIYLCVSAVVSTCLLFCVVRSEFTNCTRSSQNSAINTTLYDETKDKVILNFPCITEAGINVCRQFPNNLPNGLSSGSSVTKPLEFGATMFIKEINFTGGAGLYSCSGAVFTWRVPSDEKSRLNTKGYLLKMDRVGSASSNCRTFDIQRFKLESNKMKFTFEMFPFPFSQAATYIASLYSLPRPSPETHASSVLVIPACKRLTGNSAQFSASWSTWITAANKYPGTVEVSFGFADDSLNFRFHNYNVRLFAVRDRWALANQTQVTHTNASRKIGTYVFENVPGGDYYVQVIPDDPNFQDNLHCLCNEGDQDPNSPVPGKKCTACTRSETSIFAVKGTSDTALSDTAEAGRTDWGLVAGTVTGSFVLAYFVFGATFFCYKRSPGWKHSRMGSATTV